VPCGHRAFGAALVPLTAQAILLLWRERQVAEFIKDFRPHAWLLMHRRDQRPPDQILDRARVNGLRRVIPQREWVTGDGRFDRPAQPFVADAMSVGKRKDARAAVQAAGVVDDLGGWITLVSGHLVGHRGVIDAARPDPEMGFIVFFIREPVSGIAAP
jgi:hypothetical protein